MKLSKAAGFMIDFIAYFCFTNAMKNKQCFLVFVFSLIILLKAAAEPITTAGAFFANISDRYAQIRDYSVNISIQNQSGTLSGIMRFKRPDRLRIDFYSPADQCIVFNGSTLTIYLPTYRVMLSQDTDSQNSGASLSTPQGLTLMKRSYTIAYETGASPVPLDENSSEKVIALALNRRSAAETFKTLKVMISPESKLIRRIEAFPVSGSKITFNFSNYRINRGISNNIFSFDFPPTATVLNNFLFLD